ncbi:MULTISPECIES: YbaN family protein [Carnobacterium]|uniref:YbaN family protein n=1 Tax=Carnobacterium antarcticum TaxID=2126436 RepID=A0ABW4NJS8_9LACT|nr:MULTISPECIES: YbaN family protein [unclassified Carnobacterium]ALV21793.1 hypothetical protein NY10_1184 [Carnobacterium sp. CP1]QQP69790.1 YbaN family protein [Carnobacterium sp. CS13]
MKQLKKYSLIIIGLASFVLGAIGSFLPLLPTTPFLLLALYCFTRSSEKFNWWLKSTKLYQNYVGEYLEHRSISIDKKIKMLISIYIMVGISIYFVPILLIKVMLGLMLVTQTVVLLFFVKTRKINENE